MKTVPLSEAKARLSSLVDAVQGRDEEIVITRNGRAAAVLVSPEDLASWKETAAVVLKNNVLVGSANANKRHWYRAGDALARADRAWLRRLITRVEKPEEGSCCQRIDIQLFFFS
jgi:prevent-host-death family protein